MARRTLNFQTLIPERDEFEDTDGRKYEFRSGKDFGAVDKARANRMRNEMAAAMDALTKDEADEGAAQRFERSTTDFVRLILPTLPDERLQALSLGQKAAIAQWWQSSDEGKPAGEAQADQPKP